MNKMADANWNLVPEHIRDGIRLYVERGIPPGSFLQAVICNDLREACGRADDINRSRLFQIVQFFYLDTPSGCWGSSKHYSDWIKRGGLTGLEAA